MSLNKKSLLRCLKTMLSNASYDLQDPSKHYSLKLFSGDDSTVTINTPGQEPITLKQPSVGDSLRTLTITDDGCTALEYFIDECNKDDCMGEQVGRSAIEDEIQKLVRKWLGKAMDDTAADADIRYALKRLRDQIKPWTLYFSVENLVIKDVDEFALGGVSLMPMAAYRSILKANLFKYIDDSATDSKTKQAIKLKVDDQISNFFPADGTIASLTVNAEKSRLREVAERAMSETFGVLRGFTHLLFPRSNCCFFGVKGWLLQNPEGWVAMSDTGGQWSINIARVGALAPYEITSETIEHMRNHCALNMLHGVLVRSRSERTQLEQAIIVAAQWHGAAISNLVPAEEFVWHTVALERLLIRDGEPSSTDLFSRRLAWLLGDTGEMRKRLSELAPRLYNIRSRIVHAGETQVEPDHLTIIDQLASQAIIKLAERSTEWKTQDELKNWVDAQLMGC